MVFLSRVKACPSVLIEIPPYVKVILEHTLALKIFWE